MSNQKVASCNFDHMNLSCSYYIASKEKIISNALTHVIQIDLRVVGVTVIADTGLFTDR